MIEEAYEAAETMTERPSPSLKEELGDVLLQVVLNAQVALDRGAFGLEDVIRTINEKMRRRHPHVFAGSSEGETPPSHSSLRQSWEEIKAKEKKSEGETSERAGLFDEAKGKHPATRQAHIIGKIAAKIDFDWSTPADVLSQVRAEIEELHEELSKPETEIRRIADELGDVYFSLAQLARHLGLDPEVVSLDANQKFLKRFERVETLGKKAGIEVRSAGQDTLEKLWAQAKIEEKADT
jgi:MazG family protein